MTEPKVTPAKEPMQTAAKEPAPGPAEGATPEAAAKAMLETLKALDVDSPQDLQGMAQASQQTGNMANLLGDARKQISELQTQVQRLSTMQQTPQGRHYDDDDRFTQQPSPLPAGDNLKDTVTDAVRNVVQSEILEPQRQAQAAWLNEIAAIHGDPHYQKLPGMKEAWNEYYNLPDTQTRLQQGQATATQLFGQLKMTFMENMLRQASGVIEGLTGQPGATAPAAGQPSHVESGQVPVPGPQLDEDRQAALSQISDQRKEGTITSDQALQGIIDQFLPQGDVIWRTDL